MSLIFKNPDLLEKNKPSDKYADLYSQLNIDIDYLISFSNKCQNFGVCIVDIVNSTHTTATLTNGRACMYYSIFLNSMNAIIRRFGGKVVKNVGDSLLYYFPNTSSFNSKQAFIDLLDCGSAMLGAHEIINKKLLEVHLPPLNYKISADYGSVMIAHSVGSSDDDLFGCPVNMCAKINSFTPPNSMVIGHDLYQIMKSIGKYHFKELQGCSIGFKNRYPMFLAF